MKLPSYICNEIIITNVNYIVITFVIAIITEMKERLLEFLKKENKSSALLAEEIGVQASGISHILSGRNNPSLDFILRMLEKYPYLSTEWLLFGKGTMYKEAKMQSLFDFSQEDAARAEKMKPAEVIKTVIQAAEPHAEAYSEDSPARKSISRIIWFYDDNSFEEYFPR
jgi:transcriptional regulator with XRE-family HTH domain